jgi:hypothetical protein
VLKLVIYRAGQQFDYPGIAYDLAVEPETGDDPAGVHEGPLAIRAAGNVHRLDLRPGLRPMANDSEVGQRDSLCQVTRSMAAHVVGVVFG